MDDPGHLIEYERKMAREDGYKAYLDGWDRDENPYDNNDQWHQNQAWDEGFSDAAWDD